MKRKPTKHRAPRSRKAPVEQIDGRRVAPLLWAKTLDGILEVLDGEVTVPRLSMAHTAATLMIRLGKIDAAVAEGREVVGDQVRLAGQLDRTLRSLGIVENGSPLLGTGARAGAGASSAQKKGEVEMVTIRDWIDEGSRARDCVKKGPEYVATVRASTVAALATAKGYQILLLRERLDALDEAEKCWAKLTDDEQEIEREDTEDQERHDAWRDEDRRRRHRGEPSLPEPRNPRDEDRDKPDKNSDGKKTFSFHAHRDSPRSDE